MARAITRDPREYRRGMVLGLTLAETLLLLLFLLLMAAAAMLWRTEETVRAYQAEERRAVSRALDADRRTQAAEVVLEDLHPILEALQQQGVAVQSVAALVERLDRARTLEAERAALDAALARAEAALGRAEAARRAAETELGRLRSRTAEPGRQGTVVQDLLGAVAPLDPGQRPRAILEGLVEVLRVQPEAGQPGALDALAGRIEAAAGHAAAAGAARQAVQAREQQLAASQQEVERLRRLLAGRGGAGELYPSCWAADGKPEFAFEVTLQNGGMVVVRDAAGPARRTGEPWSRLGEFGRGVPVPIETFTEAVRSFSEWSTRQRPECRFFVRVLRDLRPGTPYEEYNRVLGPLGNPNSRHLPFYRLGG